MIFFDFEVFKYDWMVVLMNMKNKTVTKIHNDSDALTRFYEEHKNDIWCGHNVVHYDQFIMKGIMLGMNPKTINDTIVVEQIDGWRISGEFKKIPLILYDTMSSGRVGLKTYEGFLGSNIKETDVDFNINRPLTPEEIDLTFQYCTHDVEQTIEVFLRMTDEFNTMMFFIKHFNLPLSDLSLTKAQLAAKILGGNHKGKKFDDEFQFPILDCIKLSKYKFVADWYRNPENHNYEKSQEGVIIAGVPHTFSWGGGHGANKKIHLVGDFLIIDVTAYYPSLQERFKFGYRVMDNPENFEFIHNSNIEFKRKGDKKARQPFKIMDNAISGQMKQYGSALFDPMSNNSICVNGQLLLLDLIEKLEPVIECLVQNNTDGIIIKLKDYDRDFDVIDGVVAEWEQRTGMKMDFETFFGEIYQKDVNNYVLIDKENGSMKVKGAYVKKLSPLDYDLPIINKALVGFFTNGIPVEKTINECDDMIEFQKIVKLSKEYKHVEHEHCTPRVVTTGVKVKKQHYEYDITDRYSYKCYRVFASKDITDGRILKCGGKRGKPEKFANTPDHAFIENGDVTTMKCPDKLDRQWYIDLAKDRLRQYGVDKK